MDGGKMYVSFYSLRTVVERHEREKQDFKITLATIYEARDLDIERGIDWFDELVNVCVWPDDNPTSLLTINQVDSPM
jgi:hypothetical protein